MVRLKHSEVQRLTSLHLGESTSLVTNFDKDSLEDVVVFRDSELIRTRVHTEEAKESPSKRRRLPGRLKKRRLFEPSDSSSLRSESDYEKQRQRETFGSLKRDDRPFSGVLDIDGDMTLFAEVLRHLELKKEHLTTNFWDGITTRADEVMNGTDAKSPRELKEVNELLDKIKCALKSQAPL